MNCRHRNRGRCRNRQSGAALVVALLVFALCTALIVAMESEFTLFYQRASNAFLAEQSYTYLRGAEELAQLVLVQDYDADKKLEQPRDDLLEQWAEPGQRYPLDDGGWLQSSLVDLQGRFNINALVGGLETGLGEVGPLFTPAQQQFIRLLQALEDAPLSQQEAIQVVESIGDWLDGDGNVSNSGAEDDYYFSQTPAYRAANRPMSSVSELRMVANITPEIYCALLPWVTVWPQNPEKLNIHTAPAMILRTINADNDLSPLSMADAESLVGQREGAGFADLAEFLEHPVFTDMELKKVTTMLGETSSHFLLTADTEVAGRNMRLYSVLKRKERSVSAVTRRFGGFQSPCDRLIRQRDSGDRADN